jgi:serine/threonine-protein kinase HipA
MTAPDADACWLWYLGDPAAPVRIGTLRLVMGGRGVSLRYDRRWLDLGFALSEDLPLVDLEHLPPARDDAAGAVEDARPDRWGERVIRCLERPARLSMLEYLYYAGDERFGALGVSRSPDGYEPHRAGALPLLGDVRKVHELVRRVMANEPIPEHERRLLAPGSTMGGARPKALIAIDGEPWVVKFADVDEPVDSGLVEHATMTLAAKAGIRVAHTMPVEAIGGHAVAVERFDRAHGRRLPAQSAYVALRAEGSEFGYPELAQLLRRRAPVEDSAGQMRELFRRMVFNLLIDNTDDHEKNHALLMDDAQHLRLSPAFDVLPTAQGLGYQQMRVGTDGAVSTARNALSMAASFRLSAAEARREAREVAQVCASWREHFAHEGVSAADRDWLGRFVDGAALVAEREALSSAEAGRVR